MTALNSRIDQAKWMNLGVIALLVGALIYLFFWPGPEGLPLIKIGLPQRTVAIEAAIFGVNDAEIQATVHQGETLDVSVDNAPVLPMTVQSIQIIPGTVVSTQRNGSVQPQPDPRPEMQFSSSLLLTLEGKGYVNGGGVFLGLNRTRVGATIRLHAQGFDAPASIINVSGQS